MPDPVSQQKIQIVTYDGTTLRGFDGIGWYDLLSGNIVEAKNNYFISDQSGFPVLYGLDSMGAIVSEQSLTMIPKAALKASNGDVHLCEYIDPTTAGQLGAMPRDYSRIWINGVESGNWFNNQYICDEFLQTSSGDILIKDTLGRYYGVPAVGFAKHGGLLIYNEDVFARTSQFKTNFSYNEAWGFNYATSTNSRNWQFADGNWYNANGYIWDELLGLREQATIMQAWNAPNPEAPVLISVGTELYFGETVLYWLECNTGWVYRYVPSVDRQDQVVRLYVGDGIRQSGLAISRVINPFLLDGQIYFTNAGSLNKADINTGVVSVFVGANVEVMGWE